MKTKFIYLLVIIVTLTSCKSDKKKVVNLHSELETYSISEPLSLKNPISFSFSEIQINAVEHASMVIEHDNKTLYIDPVGGIEKYTAFKEPSFIIITDIHGDHLNIPTLEAINTANAQIIGPEAVKAKLPESLLQNFNVIANNQKQRFSTSTYLFDVEAIPMYNLRKEALKFHSKGRGNGYIITLNNKRIYVSGDTEDIPEMRNLENIDLALICMNLPYTMPVTSAAEAVLDFKPEIVIPYHYRGNEGFSNINQFKELVSSEYSSITVKLLDWYH
ncbi:MBL fold metallo-hydrolase [Bizionia sp. KMM 8389]